MASALGKRKSRHTAQGSVSAQEDAQAIFRRHFEAQFKPLPPATAAKTEVLQEEDEETDTDASESEWSGIEDENEPETIEVVLHDSVSKSTDSSMTKKELRAYMVMRLSS